MDLEAMSKEEKSLLLYLETCLVDNRGRIDQRKINNEDSNILKTWKDSGFIDYGRIRFDEYMERMGSHWVEFSPLAWKLAHRERIERYKRIISKREWIKTSEEE